MLKNCNDICHSFENATSKLKMLAKHENSISEVYKLKKSHKPKCFGEKKLCIFCGTYIEKQRKLSCMVNENKIDNIMVVRDFIIECAIKHHSSSPITIGNLIW